MKAVVTKRAKIALLVAAMFHTSLVLDHLPAWLTLVCASVFVLEFFASNGMRRWVRRELRAVFMVAGGLALTLSYAPHFGIEPVLSALVFFTSIGLLGATRIWWARLNVFLMSALTVFITLLNDAPWLPFAIVGNVLFQTILFFELNAPERSSFSLARYMRSALVITIPIGLAVVAVFTFLPRFYRGWFARTNVAVMGYGAAGQFSPGDVTRLARSHRKAFRVHFLDGKIPRPEELYWRGEVFEIAEGMRWRKGREQIMTEAPVLREKTHAILHDVYLEPRFETALFALDAPLQLNVEGTDFEVAQTTARIFELGGSAQRLLYYHALSAKGVQEEQLSPEKRKKFTAIDPAVHTQRVDLLLNRLALDSHDSDRAVLKLQSFFSDGNFKYTLTPSAFKGKSLDAFLFESRSGFCEHYSAAAASLLRLAGIPARVVSGFQGAERNRFDSLLTIRDSNAHAWIEYWSDNSKTWLRFDPTKAVAPERLLQGPQVVSGMGQKLFEVGFFEQGFEVLDALSVRWNGWMVGSGSAWPKNEWSQLFKGWNTHALFGVGGMCAVVLGALAFRKLGTVFRSRAISEKAVAELFEHFCETCRKNGEVRKASEGPLAFLERCLQAYPSQSAALPDFIQRYVSLRYSNEVVTEKDMKELRTRLKQAEDLVRDKKRRAYFPQT